MKPGEVSVVSLNGVAGMPDLNALELTVEWNPAVVEVTGIAAGPWQGGPTGGQVRFEAERVPGRARLQFGRAAGTTGLPEGVLANLAVRGVASGTTFLRVSAAAALAKNGPATPAAMPLTLTVE
ncbi:MAG: hypothetical protein IPL89_17255 [Acidobacteria bacterium]|nr:hypothetical protein [Acidobacteriota bacterium]